MQVPGIGTLACGWLERADWAEGGASVGLRLSPAATLSLLANGVAGSRRLIGSKVHAGIALRAGF